MTANPSEPIDFDEDDLDNAACTLFGECRGEPLLGQQAVAWVIRTRAAWKPPAWWGHNVSEVCLRPRQFSCWNKDDPNFKLIRALPFDNEQFLALRDIARAVFAGEVEDPAVDAKGNHPSHYQRVGAGAPWSRNRPIARIIGNHEYFCIGPGK